MTRQEEAALRAEVAELRKLVMNLMTVAPVGPLMLYYPHPMPQRPYPYQPYIGPATSVGVYSSYNPMAG